MDDKLVYPFLMSCGIFFRGLGSRRRLCYTGNMEKDAGIRGWIRGGGATLAFYLYAILAAPPLARALKSALADSQPHLLPGLLLLVVLLLEPFGLRWKFLFLRRRNADTGFVPQGSMLGVFSAATIGHMIVTVVVGMTMLDCWGVVGTDAETETTWLGAGVVALILKEFIELFVGGGQSVSREQPGHWKEHLADLFLLLYSCVAYTVWWEALLDLGEVAGAWWGMKLALMPFLGGLFVFLYLPLRLSFLLEEYYLQPAAGRKGRIWIELAFGAALGLYPVFA